MECQSVASGAAPAGVAAADISACLPQSVGQGSLVTEDQREVSPLSGRVMSPGDSTPIRPITDRLSLAPSSFTRRPSAPLAGRFPLRGGRRAYHVPPMYPGGEARSSTPVVRIFAGGVGAPGPDHLPFWPKRVSSLRLFLVTTLTLLHLVGHSTQSWFPTTLMLAVAVSAHALAALPREEATLSRGLHTPPLPALPGRILLAEQQVLSAFPRPQHSYIGDLVSHPNDQGSAARRRRVRCIAWLAHATRWRRCWPA